MLPYLQTNSLRRMFALIGKVYFKVIVFIITNKNNQCIPHRSLLFISVDIILDYHTPNHFACETRSVEEFLLRDSRVGTELFRKTIKWLLFILLCNL
jgi:hypothetical protein